MARIDRDDSRLTSDDPGRARLLAVGAMLLALFIPVVQNFSSEPRDDFPLSHFPMFTSARDGRTELVHAVGVLDNGDEINLHFVYAGSGGMNEVRKRMRVFAQSGRSQELCERIARRARKSGLAEADRLRSVLLVRDTYEFERFFRGDGQPTKRRILAKVEL